MIDTPTLSKAYRAPALALLLLATSGFGAAGEPVSADGSCRLTLRTPATLQWRGPLSRGYDSLSSQTHAEQARLEVRNLGGPCAYEVQIEPLGGDGRLLGPEGGLDYFIRRETGAARIEGPAALFVDASFRSDGGMTDIGFLVELPAGQKVRAGTYTNDLVITLTSVSDDMRRIEDSRVISIVAAVPPKISAAIGALANSGVVSANINLGRLHSASSADLDFSVEANSPYEIMISSENSGALAHAFSDAKLVYDLLLNGVRLDPGDLSVGAVVAVGSDSQTHDLRLQLRPFEQGAPAGRYSDRLSVRITAQ